MRLLGLFFLLSHFYYYLIYQVFKPHFSWTIETLIIFSIKKTFSRRQQMPIKFSRMQAMPINMKFIRW